MKPESATRATTSLLDQAAQTFGDALKAGVKVQDEILKWWNNALEHAAPVQEWQRKTVNTISDAIPSAQKHAQDWIKLCEHNYQQSVELMKKAFSETGSAAPDGKAMQTATQQLWQASLQAARDSAEAMTQSNVKLMEMWADFVRRNIEANGKQVSAAARTATGAAKSAARRAGAATKQAVAASASGASK